MLCIWAVELRSSGDTKASTIKLYLTGLRSYRVDLGLEPLTAFKHPRLQRLVWGIKSFHASREAIPLRERLPITRDILLRLLASLDQRSHRRWRSDAYKRYIEVHPEHIYNASRCFQFHSTNH